MEWSLKSATRVQLLGVVSFLICVLGPDVPRAQAAVAPVERDALVALYNATNGPSWVNKTNWLGTAGTECTWFGITCDTQSRLMAISLRSNNLVGTIPREIGNLQTLTSLEFSKNKLNGPLPPEIAQLTQLTQLFLQEDQLTGSIPKQLWTLTQLRTLTLADNQLEGEISPDLGNLRALTYLDLEVNRLTGPTPASIGNLQNLQTLGLRNNRLTGTIPKEIWTLVQLRNLFLDTNQFEGEISPDLGNLRALTYLTLDNNRLTGPIPTTIGNLTNLKYLYLGANRLTGTIPNQLWDLHQLQILFLYRTQLSGEISPRIGELTLLQNLTVSSNLFTGVIPASIGGLKKLEYCILSDNRLSGRIPTELGNATSLTRLHLFSNELTGAIPSTLGDLSNLQQLLISSNQLSGEIPASLTKLTKLDSLGLSSNLLSGSLPAQIGQLTNLTRLTAYANQLRGEVPPSILSLSKASVISLGDNALRASDAQVLAFLEKRPPFSTFQTVPPSNVRTTSVDSYSAAIAWTKIPYSFGPGGYQVLASANPGGPYTPVMTTATKDVESALLVNLSPSTTYYLVVQAVTYPHGGRPNYQLNTIFSDPSIELKVTTAAPSTKPAEVIVTSLPSGLVQLPGTGGAADAYTLTNIGGTSSTITLGASGSFFDQSPGVFTLAPGASQSIVITGRPTPAGEYAGASLPRGTGVSANLSVTIRLLSAPEQPGARITAVNSRIDLSAPENVNPSGTASFRNSGTAPFFGVVSSNVQFLVPQAGLIRIDPGAVVSVSISSDRSKRPDSALLSGTQVGSIAFLTIGNSGGKGRGVLGGTSLVAPVTVADTVKPAVAGIQIPALGASEVALFMSSVGHVKGSVGEFLSDVSVLNAYGASTVPDVKFYYTPSAANSATAATSPYSLGASQAVGLADVVKSVFGGDGQVGSLQIRSSKASTLSASANILNVSNPKGYYGTSIPVFRSDRSTLSGQSAFLTGLRKDVGGHTNLYLQETRGSSVTARIDFLNAAGALVGTRTQDLLPFAMASLIDPLAPETAAVQITNTAGNGAVAAYATPVDEASGDTWAVADWSQLDGFSSSEPITIPIAGSVKGANDTFFRTDVAITNRCSTVVDIEKNPILASQTACRGALSRGVLQYFPDTGGMIEKEIELGLLQTWVGADIVRTFFGIETGTIGHLLFVPTSGEFAATSRTYTTALGTAGTFGSAVPSQGLSIALRPGQSRRIGALPDSTAKTIGQKSPGTSRTNFGIVETAGQPATVRVSIFINDPRSLATGNATASKTYELAPNKLLNISGLVASVLGDSRQTLYGDLTGMSVQFDLISSTGAVLIYTSSVDNGTGDSILRTE